MKRIKYILSFSIMSLGLLATSCTEHDNGLIVNRDEVAFKVDMPGVSSRAYNLDKEMLMKGFSVTAICPEDNPNGDGILDFHCEDANLRRQVDGIFRSDSCKWPSNKLDKGKLRFFAFHPSRAEMRTRAGVGNECFVYANSTVKDASDVNYDVRMTHFRVAPDISRQVDFVTAIGEGNKTDHLYSGIKLRFEHQLSGVQVAAWGNNSLYDIEIAGWRVGGIVVEADFSLSNVIANPQTEENTIGQWYIDSKSLRGYVDYVFASGDTVVNINVSKHNTKETAVSILGGGGKALVIPQKQEMWDHTSDKTTTPKGMYFSALVRITQHDGDHHRVYPSTEPESQDYIVYLSVNRADGTVVKRLDKYGNIYGTSEKYDIPETEELRHYGWAAAPAKVDWKAGYTYSYMLDYSNGVGVHDPYDPNPAGPMIDWGGVEVTTTTGVWGSSGDAFGGVFGNGSSGGSWGAYNNNTAPDGTVWWK